MARKSKIAALTIIVIYINFILVIPAAIFLVGFSNYGKIEDSQTFYYLPIKSPLIEKIKLSADGGNIEVKYAAASTNYHAQVEIHVEISGSDVKGRSCWEFFDIDWQNKSNPIAFSVARKADTLNEVPSWSIENLKIIVILRADIVYDINVTVLEGSAEISVPFAVIVNNVAIRSITGNITLDFNQCVIGGNISGTINNGNIRFNAYNVQYSRDNAWVLTTGFGDINLTIYQYRDMGADVKCQIITTYGSILFHYEDSNPNVGAMIETEGEVESWVTLLVDPTGYQYFGFEGFQIGEDIIPPRPNEYFSNDFPTNNNYEILLTSYEETIFLMHLSSS